MGDGDEVDESEEEEEEEEGRASWRCSQSFYSIRLGCCSLIDYHGGQGLFWVVEVVSKAFALNFRNVAL